MLSCSGQSSRLSPTRSCVVAHFQKEVADGVKEIGTTNTGPRVNQYLAASGNRPGEYWCSAFVTWNFKQCGVKVPQYPGAARNYFHPGPTLLFVRGRAGNLDIAQPADVVGFYYPNLGRIGHIAFVEKNLDNAIITVEGNTGPDGGRDGQGVWRKRRMKRSIYALANHVGL